MEDEGSNFPLAVPSLVKGRYVDDIFGGADTVEETELIMNQLTQLCNAGGFPLQKWRSNSRELLSNSTEQNCQSIIPVELEESQIKVLGISWQSNNDVFQYISHPKENKIITKRSILSEISQLFDPLGFLSPILINAKMLIQELWLLRVAWDDPLSVELENRWIAFRKQLAELNTIQIPRWLNVSRTSQSVEIHGFSDASNLAMAAVVYLRVVDRSGEIKVNLVQAKTKVAPLKHMTIPRLELTAVFLLSRLISRLRQSLNCNENSIFLWTDSTVTLTWLTTHPSRWKDYVRNRVAAIQDLVPNAHWQFVPGKQNPADCASRGLSASQLKQHTLWWIGPSWLRHSPETWPSGQFKQSSEANREARTRQIAITIRNPSKDIKWDLLHKYSSLTRLLRITAICWRFINRLQKKNFEIAPYITPAELQKSQDFWIKQTQLRCFSQDYEAIKRGTLLPKAHPLTRLTPFVDDKGILRVGGRLQQSLLNIEEKHPIILPRTSRFTDLIIYEAHLNTLHGGTQSTLAYIRQKFWIIGGRAPVRSHILRCIRCARFRGRRAQQLMGQLPIPRVTPSRPFLHSGVDYAGPIMLKTWNGRAAKKYKGYIAIFVCMSTSAVHIEIVTDYTTEAFVAAYKCFTGRRGICATLYSDCGTNFVGADKALRQRFKNASRELKELANILANDGTCWRFNPPAAPHFGGKWEA